MFSTFAVVDLGFENSVPSIFSFSRYMLIPSRKEDWYSSTLISVLKTISSQDTLQKYGYLYDLSRSEKEKIHEQAVAMCIDGQPLDMVQQLLQVAVGDLGFSPQDIVQCAIKKIVDILR